MIEMRVRQDDRFKRARVERKRVPVHQPQVLVTLEQTAVDENIAAPVRHQRPGAGDRSGSAMESELHHYLKWISDLRRFR